MLRDNNFIGRYEKTINGAQRLKSENRRILVENIGLLLLYLILGISMIISGLSYLSNIPILTITFTVLGLYFLSKIIHISKAINVCILMIPVSKSFIKAMEYKELNLGG